MTAALSTLPEPAKGRPATMSDCAGCRDDFYNGKNDIGVQRCWLLDKARMSTRFRLHVDTPMNQRSGYAKVKTPNCYRQARFMFIDKIPDYAR
jgi:hypothetical protein